MKITIVGGGNVGTQLAVHCSAVGHQVTIFSSKPELFSKNLSIVDESGNISMSGTICEATNVPYDAFVEAELILVTVPPYLMDDISLLVEQYAPWGVLIGLIPGTGGAECIFRRNLHRGAILFGIQRVPSVARLLSYGKQVSCLGYRNELHVAAIPSHATIHCCDLVSGLLMMNCVPLPNYLNVTLTPSNAILHTTRLKTIFLDYREGRRYKTLPLFYEEWNEESSRLLLGCDDEIQRLCEHITDFDLSYVKSLRLHYESENAEELSLKLQSINSLKGLKTPSIIKDGYYVPDFSSRYFIADFPFGLGIIQQIGEFFNCSMDNIMNTLQWYYSVVDVSKKFLYSDYKITDNKDFIDFYVQ